MTSWQTLHSMKEYKSEEAKVFLEIRENDIEVRFHTLRDGTIGHTPGLIVKATVENHNEAVWFTEKLYSNIKLIIKELNKRRGKLREKSLSN